MTMNDSLERTCGDCIVCCTYLKVTAIDKPRLTHCPNAMLAEEERENTLFYTGLSECGNCAIYRDRPKVCSGYKCLWLQGFGIAADRPDRSGMLMDNIQGIDGAFQAKPIWAGAQDEPKAIEAVARFSRQSNKPALVAEFPETRCVRVVGRGI